MDATERLEKIEKALSELYPEVNRQKSELELLRDITSDLVIAVMEERLHIKRLRESIVLLERSITRLEQQAEKDREWMRKKWGEMAQRLGTLTEDIFIPGIPYLVKSLGYKVKEKMREVEYEKDGMRNEYDAIVIAEDESGKEVVFVAEVKSKLEAAHFDEFKTKLDNLMVYRPDYQGKIVPVLAALRIPNDLVNLATKRGVLLVRMGGEYLEPLNPEVVK